MNGIVNIKGQNYKTVAKRVEEFREKYPRFSLINEIVQIDEKVVIIKSTISDETGRILSTGFAEEKRGCILIAWLTCTSVHFLREVPFAQGILVQVFRDLHI